MLRLHVVALLLILGGTTGEAVANGLHYWTGAVDNRWSVSGNWHDHIAPVAGDQLIFGDPAYVADPHRTIVNDYPAGTFFQTIYFAYLGGWKLTGNRVSLYYVDTFAQNDGLTNELAFDIGILGVTVSMRGNLVISGSITGKGYISLGCRPLVRLTGNSDSFDGTVEVNQSYWETSGDIAIDGSLPHVTLFVFRGTLVGSGTVQFIRLAKGTTLYRLNEQPQEPLSHLRATAVDQDCPQPGCPLPPVYADVRDVPLYFEIRDADHYATLATSGEVLLQNLWMQIVSGPAVAPNEQLTIIRSGGLAELATRQNGVPRYMQWSGRFPWLVDVGANSGRDVVITRRSWPGSFQGPQAEMADILWRNDVTGANAVWVLSGRDDPRTVKQVVNLPSLPNTDYRVAGTADFDGDGNSDILWWNRTTGAIALWLMNATELRSIVDLPAVPDTAIQPVATGDFDFDGRPEIVFHNLRTGLVSLWVMNGASFASIVDMSFSLDPAHYRIRGIVNTAGATGLLVQTGSHIGLIWTIRYNADSPYIELATLAPGEEAGGAASFDLRNDWSNLVIRNPSTGTVAIDAYRLPSLPDPDWHVAGPR